MTMLGRLLGRRKPLNCAQVADVLQTYLDHELDDVTAAKVVEHLDDCRRCGLEAETYETLMTSLRHGPGRTDPASVARLRDFGERLARGELDPDDLLAPRDR